MKKIRVSSKSLVLHTPVFDTVILFRRRKRKVSSPDNLSRNPKTCISNRSRPLPGWAMLR